MPPLCDGVGGWVREGVTGGIYSEKKLICGCTAQRTERAQKTADGIVALFDDGDGPCPVHDEFQKE